MLAKVNCRLSAQHQSMMAAEMLEDYPPAAAWRDVLAELAREPAPRPSDEIDLVDVVDWLVESKAGQKIFVPRENQASVRSLQTKVLDLSRPYKHLGFVTSADEQRNGVWLMRKEAVA